MEFIHVGEAKKERRPGIFWLWGRKEARRGSEEME